MQRVADILLDRQPDKCCACRKPDAHPCTCASCSRPRDIIRSVCMYCSDACADVGPVKQPCSSCGDDGKRYCVHQRAPREASSRCRVCKNGNCRACEEDQPSVWLCDRSRVCADCTKAALEAHFNVAK